MLDGRSVRSERLRRVHESYHDAFQYNEKFIYACRELRSSSDANKTENYQPRRS